MVCCLEGEGPVKKDNLASIDQKQKMELAPGVHSNFSSTIHAHTEVLHWAVVWDPYESTP
jgi:hypothetical protein